MAGKRLSEVKKTFDKNKSYTTSEAIQLVKANATAKFDETIEIAMVLGVDPKHADQQVRGMVTLPNGTGKSLRVAVFARGAKAEEAKNAGADFVGAEELAEEIKGGMFDFDRCIATPDMMAVVGKLGKILGTKGLMPNPKLGTVTMDVTSVIKAAKAGQLQYRTDSSGLIHAGVGKASFDEKALEENVKMFIDTIVKAKPSGAKGAYLKKITLSSTQGAGVNINIASL